VTREGQAGRDDELGLAPAEAEGVVKYDARHTDRPLPATLAPLAMTLAAWRHPLRALGWLGRQEGRYGGYGFGNLSMRLPTGLVRELAGELAAEDDLDPGDAPFLVTGSQTGGEARLGLAGFALVARHDLAANRLWSRGGVAASSESLTHAALYAASPGVGAVFHVHAPELWRRRDELGLETTSADVAYGTPAMAAEVAGSLRRLEPRDPGARDPGGGLVAMAGHEDGILAWGPDPAAAGRALLAAAGWWA